MASDDGPRGWAFLRRNPAYRAAWSGVGSRPVLEAAPFPVRIQSTADRDALAWGLLAWKNPHGTHGDASAFWAAAPMLEGEWGKESPALAELIEHSGARLAGLRLADGTLILKIENRTEAVQVRVGSGAGPGLVLQTGLGQGSPQASAESRPRPVLPTYADRTRNPPMFA